MCPPRAAQALYNFLIEKCFGFGQGSVELSYAQIAQVIGRCWRTVARAAGKLRKLGFAVLEPLPGGIYRWRIPVLAEEVKDDPYGVLLVLDAASSQASEAPIPIPSGYDSSVIYGVSGGDFKVFCSARWWRYGGGGFGWGVEVEIDFV